MQAALQEFTRGGPGGGSDSVGAAGREVRDLRLRDQRHAFGGGRIRKREQVRQQLRCDDLRDLPGQGPDRREYGHRLRYRAQGRAFETGTWTISVHPDQGSGAGVRADRRDRARGSFRLPGPGIPTPRPRIPAIAKSTRTSWRPSRKWGAATLNDVVLARQAMSGAQTELAGSLQNLNLLRISFQRTFRTDQFAQIGPCIPAGSGTQKTGK